MSIFIAAEGQPIQHCRKDSVDVGLNALGDITLEDCTPYITVDTPSHLIVVKKPGVLLGDAGVLEGTEIPFAGLCEIAIKKKKLKLWSTNLATSLLARTACTGIESIQATLTKKIQLLSFVRKNPKETSEVSRDSTDIMVPCGTFLRCGSSEQDAVYIKGEGIRKAHCEIQVSDDGEIVVSPCTGLINGTSLPVNLSRGQSLQLSNAVSLYFP